MKDFIVVSGQPVDIIELDDVILFSAEYLYRLLMENKAV